MGYDLKYTGKQLDDSIGGFNAEALWDDINFEGISLATGNSAPDIIVKYGTGDIRAKSFDGINTLEQVWGGDEIKHSYKEGTDILFHVHWMPTTADVGAVKWFLEYAWYNSEGDAEAPTLATISVTQQASGIPWHPHAIHFPPISGVNKKIGSHFEFKFYRNPSDVEDTYNADATVSSLGIHYQKNSDGSRQVFIK